MNHAANAQNIPTKVRAIVRAVQSRHFVLLVGTLVVAAVSSVRSAENGSAAIEVEAARPRIENARGRIQHLIQTQRVPGVSLAVVEQGAIVWAQGFGVSRRGDPRPVDSETLFQAASISKPVSAYGIMKLVEDHRLNLDDNVNRHLRAWKVPENSLTSQQPVTLRRLLSHAGGLTVHGFDGYAPGETLPSLPQILRGESPANNPAIVVDLLPGSQFRYSGGGITVAQLLAEEATGQPFGQWMRDNVLQPSGLSSSTFAQPLEGDWIQRAASGHSADGTPLQGFGNIYPELAAAGLWTTPADLAKFTIQLFEVDAGAEDRVVHPATLHEMLRPQIGEHMGLGLFLDGGGIASRFSHGGANAGFRSLLVAVRGTRQAAIVMNNSDAGELVNRLIVSIIAKAFEWPPVLRPEEAP